MKEPINKFASAVLSFLMLLLLACSGNREPVDSLPWIPRDLASSAKVLNDRCPEMIDPESRLDSVLLRDQELCFYYTLPNKLKGDIPSAAFTAFLMSGIVDNIQKNPKMEMFRDSSVQMLFRYLDRNGELITEFSVGPERYLRQ